jgi:hypothetical protein
MLGIFDSQQLVARFAGFSGDLVHHAFGVLTLNDERAAISHSGDRPTGLCALSETKTLHHFELPGGEVQEHTETSSVRVISIREVSVPLTVFEPPRGLRKILPRSADDDAAELEPTAEAFLSGFQLATARKRCVWTGVGPV